MEEHFDKMDVHFDKMDYHFNELMDQLINQQKWYMDQVDKQNKKFEKLNQKLENQRMHSVSQDRDSTNIQAEPLAAQGRGISLARYWKIDAHTY